MKYKNATLLTTRTQIPLKIQFGIDLKNIDTINYLRFNHTKVPKTIMKIQKYLKKAFTKIQKLT